jgi:hypothetical protein
MRELLTPRLVVEAVLAFVITWIVLSQTLIALAEIQ